MIEAYKKGGITREEYERWFDFLKKITILLEFDRKGKKEEFNRVLKNMHTLKKDVQKIERKALSIFLDGLPNNENAVIFAFGRLYSWLKPEIAKLIGEESFDKLVFKTEYPDAEIVKNNKKLGIEFQYKSSDFKRDSHNVGECDLIVCWVHDWLECPIKVLELRTFNLYEP